MFDGQRCICRLLALTSLVAVVGTADAAWDPASDIEQRVHIAAEDGAGSAGVCQIETATDTAPRKFHPGHYVSLNRFDNKAAMLDAIAPGVVGIQKRYFWKDFESSPGKYDFSVVQSDLDLLARKNAQLVVFVEDKSFNGDIPTPSYLREYTLQNRAGGYTVKRWDPYVVERMKTLLAALGKHFDCHPNFEGVALQETSLSLDDQPLSKNNYSPERYRDALIEVLLSAASSMPTSQVFWYMNFFPQHQKYIDDVANAVASAGVAMGGPDVLPDNRSLTRLTYPFYDDFKGRMTLFTSIQYASFAHKHEDGPHSGKYWTMGELFRFARDELHVDYIFWNRKSWRKPADSYDWTDALPVIADNPEF